MPCRTVSPKAGYALGKRLGQRHRSQRLQPDHRGGASALWKVNPLRASARRTPELGRSSWKLVGLVLPGQVLDAGWTQGSEKTDKGREGLRHQTLPDLGKRSRLALIDKGRQDPQRTHNPSAVGSSPTRPNKLAADASSSLTATGKILDASAYLALGRAPGDRPNLPRMHTS